MGSLAPSHELAGSRVVDHNVIKNTAQIRTQKPAKWLSIQFRETFYLKKQQTLPIDYLSIN